MSVLTRVDAPTVAVLPLGGTIVGARTSDGGYEPRLSAGDVFGALGGEYAVHVVEGLVSRPSAELRFDDVLAVYDAATTAVDRGAVGAVVLCGTDTLEEVAFALDVLWQDEAPVVVTGALRPPDVPGADGPANVDAALRVAADPRARGRGCLVVLNDDIHAARYVRKAHTSSPGAFQSALGGPVGAIVEGTPVFLSRTARPAPVPRSSVGTCPPVALVTFALDADAALLRAVAAAGYAGVVVEASGGGSVSARWAEALGALAAHVPVVYASRTGAAPVLRETYGGAGGEIDLVRRGLVPAGVLDGLKARILLSLAIAATGSPDEARTLFRGHSAAEGTLS